MKEKIVIGVSFTMFGFALALAIFPENYFIVNNPVVRISKNADKCLTVDMGSYTYEAFTIGDKKLFKESCRIDRVIDYGNDEK